MGCANAQNQYKEVPPISPIIKSLAVRVYQELHRLAWISSAFAG
jgi:hypothetical protein